MYRPTRSAPWWAGFSSGFPFVVILFLAACNSPPPESSDRAYRHSLVTAVRDLDPLHASSRSAGFLVQNIFETLYRYEYLTRPYRLTPELAADMPEVSADGLTVRIEIAPGHFFSDHQAFPGGSGREVTAEDVAYSLRRHFDATLRSEGRWLWRDWLRASDPDDPCAQVCAEGNTVTIHLTRPYPQLAATLATPFSAVVPREVVEAEGELFQRRPVGSGPYRLTSLDEFSARLEANPRYHRPTYDPAAEGFDEAGDDSAFGARAGQPLPLTPLVEVTFAVDETARWIAFDGDGSLDLIRLPAAQVAAVLEGADEPWRLKPALAGRYALTVTPELGFLRLDFNMADASVGHAESPAEAERNRKLRCAVQAADSWDRRRTELYAGMGQVFEGIVPPRAGEVRPAPEARASASFDGYYPQLNYGAVTGTLGQRQFDYFRTQLVKAGYPVERIAYKKFAGLGDLIKGIADRKVNVFLTGWAMDYPDPMNNFQVFFGPNRLPGANFASFDDGEFNAAFAQAEMLPPSPARRRHLQTMTDVLSRECVTLSGMARHSVFLRQAGIVAEPDTGPVNGVMLRFVHRMTP